jgi:hypothetical protein
VKNIGNNDKLVFLLILVILVAFGIEQGSRIITNLNLLDMLLSGFIAFAIVGIIMAVFNKVFGIWLGHKIGVILFFVVGYIVSQIIFN